MKERQHHPHSAEAGQPFGLYDPPSSTIPAESD